MTPISDLPDVVDDTTGRASERIAALVASTPERIASMSITALAALAETTPATVSRYAQRLGYSGYPSMRTAIATENGRASGSAWEHDIGGSIGPDDPADRIVTALAAAQMRAVRAAAQSIDLDGVTRLADDIATASRVHILGEWADAVPAEELYNRLLRIGRPVWMHRSGLEAKVGASLLAPGDVALLVCRDGTGADGAAFLAAADERGAHTALLTGEPSEPLAAAARTVLDSGTRVGTAWTEHFAGRAGDTLVAGLLWVLVAQRVGEA